MNSDSHGIAVNNPQNDASRDDDNGKSARRPFAGFGKPPANLAELPDKLLALLRQTPAAEIEQNLKNIVNSTITKLDLVTREEFEIQQAMIEKLRVRVERLESALSERTGEKP